jgi:hypothetical protein
VPHQRTRASSNRSLLREVSRANAKFGPDEVALIGEGAEIELPTQVMNLPLQRPRYRLALLSLVVVIELLTVLVVENWIYDFGNPSSQVTMQAVTKNLGHT